jgi:hypothetical protein
MVGKRHVRCSFDSCVLEKLQAPPKKDHFAKLMQAHQQQHFVPDKDPSPEDGK